MGIVTAVTHRRNDRNVRPVLKDTFDQVDIVFQVLSLVMMTVFHEIGLHCSRSRIRYLRHTEGITLER